MTENEGAKPGYHHGDLRGALLKAARLILEEQGPRALTLREAARRAGVSHAAPRYHFASLRVFMADCAATGFDELAEQLARAWIKAGGDADPDMGLSEMGKAYVLFAMRNRAVFRLMFDRDTYAAPTPILSASGERAYSVLVRGVTALDPTVSQDRISFAVATLWSLVHGFATLTLEGKIDGPKPRQGVVGEQVAAAVRMFLPGYRAQSHP